MSPQEEISLLKSGNEHMCEELEILRAALEPFRIAAEAFPDLYGDGVMLGTELVTVGMLRAARSALALTRPQCGPTASSPAGSAPSQQLPE